MNPDKIDVVKSIELQKIVTNYSIFLKILDRYVIILLLVFPIMAITDIYYSSISNEPITNSIIYLVLSLAVIFTISYLYSKINRLLKIKGVSKDKNTKLVHQILKDFQWSIVRQNENTMIVEIPWTKSNNDFGKQIVIIFNKADIFINIKSFLLHHSPSPLNQKANKNLTIKLKDEIKEKLNSEK